MHRTRSVTEQAELGGLRTLLDREVGGNVRRPDSSSKALGSRLGDRSFMSQTFEILLAGEGCSLCC